MKTIQLSFRANVGERFHPDAFRAQVGKPVPLLGTVATVEAVDVAKDGYSALLTLEVEETLAVDPALSWTFFGRPVVSFADKP